MSPRLFWSVVSIEARAALSYRVDFWLNMLVGFTVQFGIVYFLWTAMFRESGREIIGGYTLDGMIIYYLSVILLGKLVRGREMEQAVSTDIYEGSLNRYLIFPARYFGFKYAQHVGMMGPGVMQFALFGPVVYLVLDVPAHLVPQFSSVLMSLAAIAVGNVLHYLLSLPLQLVAFWADNVWSLEVAKRFFTTLLGGLMIPLSLFPEWAQGTLYFLPFRFFFDFPARVMLNQIGPIEWAIGTLVSLGWCVVFWAVCAWVWRRGRLHYTGVGI